MTLIAYEAIAFQGCRSIILILRDGAAGVAEAADALRGDHQAAACEIEGFQRLKIAKALRQADQGAAALEVEPR